jgi:hypothetical protein
MRCINPAQLAEGSRNLKSVALTTVEISSKVRPTTKRQRHVTDGKLLLSTYEIWKVLVSLAKKKIYRKNEFRAKKKFRLSYGVAVGFWTKFEAQLAQPS